MSQCVIGDEVCSKSGGDLANVITAQVPCTTLYTDPDRFPATHRCRKSRPPQTDALWLAVKGSGRVYDMSVIPVFI
jgi:hypothetical protein